MGRQPRSGCIAALNVEIAEIKATAVEAPPTRLGMLDVDQVVAQWRRRELPSPPQGRS